VTKFTPDKGFGFVKGSDGTSYFFHQKQFVDGSAPNEGDYLTYDLEPSPLKEGQMQGCNITGGSGQGKSPKGKGKGGGKGKSKGGGGGGGWSSAPKAPGTNSGTVANFTPDKGFGFVTGSDGTQYFFHQKQFVDGTAPNVGDALTFDLEPSPLKPGQMQACNIAGGSGQGKSGGKGKGGGKGKDSGKKGGGGKGKDGGKGGEPRLSGTKHQMCTHFQAGTCRKGPDCTFAHSEAEVGTKYGPAKGGKGGGGGGPYDQAASWGGGGW